MSAGRRDAQDDQEGHRQAERTARHDQTVRRDLYDLARRMDVPGRSRMSKGEPVQALQNANDRATARARS